MPHEGKQLWIKLYHNARCFLYICTILPLCTHKINFLKGNTWRIFYKFKDGLQRYCRCPPPFSTPSGDIRSSKQHYIHKMFVKEIDTKKQFFFQWDALVSKPQGIKYCNWKFQILIAQSNLWFDCPHNFYTCTLGIPEIDKSYTNFLIETNPENDCDSLDIFTMKNIPWCVMRSRLD